MVDPWAEIARADSNASTVLTSEETQKQRLDRAQTRSVYLATPIARHPVRQYKTAMCKTHILLAQLGIRAYAQEVVGSSNLPRARNDLVASFMASGYDDLMFIDDDMGWEANDVLRLLASDKAVIGGVGCKKSMRPDTDPDRWCFRALPVMVQDDMGAIEVECVGTGFLKISRGVFARLAAEHPDWKRRGWRTMPEDARAHYYQFFRFDPNDPDEYGEDFAFCKEWRRLGGSVWIDPTIRLKHVGEYEYTGNIEALFEAREARCA